MLNNDPNIKNIQRKDHLNDPREVAKEKPKDIPYTRKSFKDIVEDEDKFTDVELEKAKMKKDAATKTSSDRSSRAPSLFDLSSASAKQTKPKEDDSEAPVDSDPVTGTEEEQTQIFQNLAERLASKEEKGSGEHDSSSQKNKFNTEYTQEQPDLSFVNPLSQYNSVQSINQVTTEKIGSVTSPIHDIVTELIDKLTIIKTQGQTDTSVTLNMPGMFKGTIIVISQFESAPNQLNLAFENLTQQAKLLLDSLANRETLLNSLSKEGYTIQNMTTTTIIEHAPIVDVENEEQLKDFNQGREEDRQSPERERQ